jgi:quinol monooxygenase YgiN
MTEMTELHVTARFSIHEGKFEEFEALAEQCIQIVRDQDTGGTLQYDWFFNEDHDECVVLERYRDSAAVLEHIGHVGEALPALMEVSDLVLEVFGSPSPELVEASSGLAPKVYHFHSGI